MYSIKYYISYSNIRRWYKFYVEWREIKIMITNDLKKYWVMKIISDSHVSELKIILVQYLENYLD